MPSSAASSPWVVCGCMSPLRSRIERSEHEPTRWSRHSSAALTASTVAGSALRPGLEVLGRDPVDGAHVARGRPRRRPARRRRRPPGRPTSPARPRCRGRRPGVVTGPRPMPMRVSTAGKRASRTRRAASTASPRVSYDPWNSSPTVTRSPPGRDSFSTARSAASTPRCSADRSAAPSRVDDVADDDAP